MLFSNERGTRLTKAKRVKGSRPFVTAGYENNGVAEYIGNLEQKIFDKDVITIDIFGNTFFRNYVFSADDNILVLSSLIGKISNDSQIYIASSINKAIVEKYSYGKQFRKGSFNETNIILPTHPDGTIAFDYMESYIEDREAYLIATGLNDYILTEDEKKLVNSFRTEENVSWQDFNVASLFDKSSTRGKRLKSSDRIE